MKTITPENVNCTGFALTRGDFAFIDDPSTEDVYEGGIKRKEFLEWDAYEEMIDDGTGDDIEVGHACIINSDGTYDAKGGGRDLYPRFNMTKAEFYQPYTNHDNPEYRNTNYHPGPGNTGRIIYYRHKYNH